MIGTRPDTASDTGSKSEIDAKPRIHDAPRRRYIETYGFEHWATGNSQTKAKRGYGETAANAYTRTDRRRERARGGREEWVERTGDTKREEKREPKCKKQRKPDVAGGGGGRKERRRRDRGRVKEGERTEEDIGGRREREGERGRREAAEEREKERERERPRRGRIVEVTS